MGTEQEIVDVVHTGKPRRFVFVLMQNFTLLSFASALDSLRIANQTAAKTLYSWQLVG